MGGEMTTFTGPGRIYREPRGWMARVPLMLTGTMGLPAFMAMMNTPFLKGNSSREVARVPSGKMMMERPFLISSAAWLRLRMDSWRLLRSTEIFPRRLMTWPNRGI
jgi:hypothetical protein